LTGDVISTKLIESLYPYVVGVIKGSAIIDILATQYPKFKVTIYSSRFELLAAVKKGQVKVIAAISASTFSANEFSTLFPQTKRISLFNHPISVGVLKSNQNLINLREPGRSKVSQAALHQLSRK
jgi:ABC-type amino acid transport substrate-binding protein